MARAGESVGTRNPGVSHGICLAVFPDVDPDPHVELQRTTAANGSTTGGVPYQVVGVVDVQSGERALQYRDALPADNKTYWYRARNIRQNYNASTWTNLTWGIPTNLPAGELPYPAVRMSANATGVSSWYGANSSWRAALLRLGSETVDYGNMYENSTAFLAGSTFICRREYVTVPFDGVYNIDVAGSYSSFHQVVADEVLLRVVANVTTHGSVPDTYLITGGNIGEAYSWAPWGQMTSQGAFALHVRSWIAGGTRLSLLASRTFLSSTNTNIEFKNNVVFDVAIRWK